MSALRACTVLIYGQRTNAYFHRFSDDIYLDEGNNAIPVTRAVVELDDGTVFIVKPNEIKFTDR
ncbi:hypothetical protein [Alcaligenes nematophilus]|uniref:hypothetical protein n=1 Tax=Alcaligenes nematophilus TaxID=2994643 RepID=UPI00384A53AB